MLHTTLKIKTVHEKPVTFYKKFHSRFSSHPNPLISNLATFTIPDDPSRRLKRKLCRDLLNG